MHLRHWGLNQPLFSSKVNANHYFKSSTHEEAAARIQFLVQQNRRLGMLLGTSGTGKTMLFDITSRQLRRSGCFVAKLNILGLDGIEFLWKFANALGGVVPNDAGHVRIWQAIQDRLATLRYQRIATVVLIDDADECETEVLTLLNRVVQMEQQPDSRLNIVLACNTHRTQLVGSRLLDLCELPISIEPLDAEETMEYVNHATRRAGRETPIFSVDGFAALYTLTQGIPRAINRLVDLCLIVGAAEDLSEVDGETVESIQDSFEIRQLAA